MPDSERPGDGATTVASGLDTPATSPSAEHKTRKRVAFALRLLLSVALLAWVMTKVDGARVVEILSDVDWLWLALAIAILVLGRVLVAYRWYLLVREHTSHVSFLNLLRIVVISGFVGAVMPGAVGIELYRMYALGRGTTLALGVSSVVVERLSALIGLVLMVSLGLAWEAIEGSLALPRAVLLATALSILCVAVVAVFVVNRSVRRLSLHLVRSVLGARIADRIESVFAHIDAFHGNRRLLGWMIGLSLVLQALRVLEVLAMAMALTIRAPIAAFVVIVPIGILVALLPISVQGLGVREALYVTLFGAFGMTAAAAFTLSLFSFLVFFAVLVLPGALLFALHGGTLAAAGSPAATPASGGGLRPPGRFSFLRR